MAINAAPARVVHPSQRAKVNRRQKSRNSGSDALPTTSEVMHLPDLTPGFRDRLLERLGAMGLPQEKQVSFVADLTGRARQTVRRWLAGAGPGLPDLRSFARLCLELDISADEVMGFDRVSRGQAKELPLLQVARCVHAVACALGRKGRPGRPVMISGDEMAPRLREGDLAFVDHESGYAGNGLYAVEVQGEVLIRRLERQLGRGWLLKCDNKAYSDSEFDEAAAVRDLGLRLLGKVRGTIAIRLY